MKTFLTNKNTRILLISCLLIAFRPCAWAQTTSKKLFIVIDVIAEDTAMLHGNSIAFNMSKSDINTSYPGYTKSYSQRINSPKTRMVIPLSTPVNYGRIELDNKTADAFKPLNNGNNLFLFQSGDTIELHLSNHKKGAFFTGKNTNKYNCMYRISNNADIVSFSQSNSYFKSKNFAAAFTSKKLQYDSIYAVQERILREFEGKFNREVFNLIGIDCQAAYHQRIIELYYGIPFMIKGYEEQIETAKGLFIKEYGNYKEPLIKDRSLFVKSYKYADFLSAMEKAYAVIINSSPEKSYYSSLKFSDIDKAIDLHNKKGILKDKLKLLALLSIDKKKQADYTSYISQIINEAGNNQFKKALIAFRDINSIGSNAFPFELPDEHGKMYKLADFKGKMVIMDFWFTGCEGCIGMANTLKKIASAYKSNPNIIFVTVSIDRNKEIWRKSLAAETYSCKDEINLLAGMDRQSAVIQRYHINSFPTIIAISKEGKIISTAPPDPRADSAVFKKFINQHL